MKTVCRALELARSHVNELHHRAEGWRDGRTCRAPVGDAQLIAEVRMQIADLPSYGYRRACALVNRQRAQEGAARVNPKRAYRVMAQAGLLLPKAPRRRQSSRAHDGVVAVDRSDLRWCSDGFEIKCDSGETVTTTFAKDCCDREVMAWRAWQGKGLPGEPVREMLIEAVERRFGDVEAIPDNHVLEWRLHRRRYPQRGPPARAHTNQHARVQPAEQRHGRKLRQHIQARLCQSNGPDQRAHGDGTAAGRIRALQRGASALVAENAIPKGVQAAAGRHGAPVPTTGAGANLRLERVWEYGGKITKVEANSGGRAC